MDRRDSTDSRSSTATLPEDLDFRPEEVPDYLFADEEGKQATKRFVVAVDFGTTYSAVSYVVLEKGESTETIGLNRIQSIKNYPNDRNNDLGDRMKCEVPTEVIYPLDKRFRKWDDLAFNERVPREVQSGREDTDEDGDTSDENPEAADGEDVDDDVEMFDADMEDDVPSFRWGYGVHEAWCYPEMHSDATNKPLARFKLLLDNSPITKEVREDLSRTIETLCGKKIIKKNSPAVDIIADYLTCLLRHVKDELTVVGFERDHALEIVLCVPAIWTQKACRDMQTAMAMAMKRARLQGVDAQNNSIENLFIVSEPEAAAAYVLELNHEIIPGDTFMLLDAGGGTVDVNTYTVSQTTPLRLSREVIRPDGGLFGSSYINQAFRKHLRGLIKEETYLEQGLETLDGIVEKYMIDEFEYKFKRSFDYDITTGRKRVQIPYLKDNPEKRIKLSSFWIPRVEIRDMFTTCFDGIAKLMEDQIEAARLEGVQVDKVIIIGGFASLRSLRGFIKKRLRDCEKAGRCKIDLIDPPTNTATAVASGAVLRALNKEQGPRRLARSSYGILRTEHFGEREHEGVKPSLDPLDGQEYVKDTIDWKLKLGREVEPVWKCKPFLCSHTFKITAPKLVCREVLYVSDRSTESHYKRKHPKNEGAEKVGEIVVDFTFLRDQGLIRPIEPTPGSKGKRHYRINYTMGIRVVDRDLKCVAVYNQKVVKKCQINIASAFRPGVK